MTTGSTPSLGWHLRNFFSAFTCSPPVPLPHSASCSSSVETPPLVAITPSFYNLKISFNSLRQCSSTSRNYRKIRNRIFNQIAGIHKATLTGRIICLSDDTALWRAETLKTGPLKDFEGAKIRLQSHAANYQKTFALFQKAVLSSRKKFPQSQFEELIACHTLFSHNYLQEFVMAYPNDSQVVKATHGSDIHLFKAAFFSFFNALFPEKKAAHHDMILERDPELILLVPKLALLYLLKSTDPTPQILNNHKTDFEKLKDEYLALPRDEQNRTDAALQGEKDPLLPSSALVKSLESIATNLTRATSAALSASLFQNVYAEIENDLPKNGA